ncbi:MAG: macro domain-containing protein [Lachnospiraceae bacterium]|nr:macro domain-containing protein [Lachnospiraceae bacterium]
MPFQIIRNNITKVKADAIVNTANPKPMYSSGTDGAIYKAAGEDSLLAERKKIGNIKPGEVAVTPAFNLKAKYIIHTVGPVWQSGNKVEFDILKSCYRRSLEKAAELGCNSIAFPLIATGVYGFPKAEALKIAMSEISDFLMREDVDMTVKLVVFDETAFRLSQNIFFQIESYIDNEVVLDAYKEEYGLDGNDFDRERARHRRDLELSHHALQAHSKTFNEDTMDKSLYMKDEKEDLSFQEHLLKLIIAKDMDNKVVYKSSNVSKGAFSKIMCGDTKKPQKKTVLGLCIGLKLNLDEARDLLASADMAFNPYNKRDKLVIDCIEREQYNIMIVNGMLFSCKQPLLGS